MADLPGKIFFLELFNFHDYDGYPEAHGGHTLIKRSPSTGGVAGATSPL
jgi:hypothetical protein